MRNVNYKIVNGTTITGSVVSKGELFTATANLFPGDIFSENIGKLIVKYRLEIKQRKRDLRNTNEVIKKLQEIYKQESENKPFSEVSKHWMRFIQDACNERKAQLENIAFAKLMLNILTNGNGSIEDMIRVIITSHYNDERTIGLLINLVNIVRENTNINNEHLCADEKTRKRSEYINKVTDKAQKFVLDELEKCAKCSDNLIFDID